VGARNLGSKLLSTGRWGGNLSGGNFGGTDGGLEGGAKRDEKTRLNKRGLCTLGKLFRLGTPHRRGQVIRKIRGHGWTNSQGKKKTNKSLDGED